MFSSNGSSRASRALTVDPAIALNDPYISEVHWPTISMVFSRSFHSFNIALFSWSRFVLRRVKLSTIICICMVNSELVKLADWFIANCLSLNAKKPNYFLYRTKETWRMHDYNKYKWRQDWANWSCKVPRSLYWEEHIKQIRSKVSKNIGILWKLKAYLTSKLLFMVYNSLILPYITYCNLIWSSANESKLDMLVALINNNSFAFLVRYLHL